MSSALLTAVLHEPSFFDEADLQSTMTVNKYLRSNLSTPYFWLHRCLAKGFVVNEESSTLCYSIDWFFIYRLNRTRNAQSVSFRVSLGPFCVSIPIESFIAPVTRLTEIISAAVGQPVHLHHKHLNGSVGAACLESDSVSEITAVSCDCDGFCKNMEISNRVWSDGWIVCIVIEGLKTFHRLPRELLDCERPSILTLSDLIAFLKIDRFTVTLEALDGSRVNDAGNLLLLEDMRLTQGETLEISTLPPGIIVRRRPWNLADALTIPKTGSWDILGGGVPAENSVFGNILPIQPRQPDDYSQWWCETPPEEFKPAVMSSQALPPLTAVVPTIAALPEGPRMADRGIKQPHASSAAILSAHECQPARALMTTLDARQFEFHPHQKDWLLVGRRGGDVTLVDWRNDKTLATLPVDAAPVLGLAWLHRHPGMAVYGSSLTGRVGLLSLGTNQEEEVVEKESMHFWGDEELMADFAADDFQVSRRIYSNEQQLPYSMINRPLGHFSHLSSVSVNCTDDYLMMSGFTRDIGLLDLHTGRQIAQFGNVHSNFINILRFSNSMPHVFATSSFDSTCKLWDLRCCGRAFNARPVFTAKTDSLNVMCCFSADDTRLLVSGLDHHVSQLAVQKGLETIDVNADIVTKNSPTNYRRSVYLSNENPLYFASAGTDEDFVTLINADSGKSCGNISFHGVIDSLNQPITEIPQLPFINERNPTRLFTAMVSRLMTWSHRRTPYVSSTELQEYVQSLRAHPSLPDTLAVLVSPFDSLLQPVVCVSHFNNDPNATI